MQRPSDDDLLLTLLRPPSLAPDLVDRQRLWNILERSAFYPLTLVSGSAGSGKTTLITQWANQFKLEPAWLTLEPAFNDPVLFWRYFSASLQTAFPELGITGPPNLHQATPESFFPAVNRICNALSLFNRPLFMVIDDLHLIENPDCLASLAYFLDHQPGLFHLIFMSRSQPALPLTKMRAANRLLEINGRDLNFSQLETSQLINQLFPGQFEERHIEHFTRLTNGWPAGIRLLALAVKENQNQWDGLNQDRRPTSDYLTQEVLDRTPRDLVTLMEKLSVFDSFSSSMAAEILEETDISLQLNRILDSNLFLIQTEDTYRFYPFFRDLLRRRLSPSRWVSTNQKVMDWYVAHDQPQKAIPHGLEAQDWPVVSSLIIGEAEKKLQNGEVISLENWLSALPQKELERFPDLLTLSGWIWYLRGNVVQARELVSRLEAKFQEITLQRLGWWFGLLCQLTLIQEQNRQALILAEQALKSCKDEDLFIRGLLLNSLGSAQQALGETCQAAANFKEAYRINRLSGNELMSVFALANLGVELNNQGRRLEALALCQDVLEEAGETPTETNPVFGILYLLNARLLWEANLLPEAQQALDIGKLKLDLLGIPGLVISADWIQVQILIDQDAYEEAKQIVNRDLRMVRSMDAVGYKRLFNSLKCEIALRSGSLARVKNWLEEAGLPPVVDEDPAREYEFLLKARFLIESGAWAEAGQTLADLEAFAKRFLRSRLSLAVYLVKATLFWKKGELGPMKNCLEEALALSAPQNYTRLILNLGAPLSAVITHPPDANWEITTHLHPFTGTIEPHKVDLLTCREMDVLRLLAENHTNNEIALQLVLSSETIKIHVKHIFQKLGVENRRQAVRKAQELELL